MTHESSPTPTGEGADRRSFLKAVSAATAGAALVGTGAGSAVAQDDDDGGGWQALIFADNFHPEGRFAFVSGVVEWSPNYGDVRDSWFTDYNTYMIRWLNTDEVVPLYVAQDADIGEYDEDLGFVTDADDDANQPQLYEMDQDWAPFSDNPRLVNVNVSPVGEDEEDDILDTDDWWEDGNGGNATDDDGNESSLAGL